MSVSLFQKIEHVVPTIRYGWCSVEKAQTLAAIIVTFRPQTVLEIGVYGGKSFIPMALAMKELGQGLIYGIDPWSRAASSEGQLNPADKNFWSGHDHEPVYQDFINRLTELGLNACSKVIRAKSDDVQPPKQIDFFHLDGNHGEQAVRDVTRFSPNCRIGSLALLDDCGWTGNFVAKAADNLCGQGWIRLYNFETGALFQKLK